MEAVEALTIVLAVGTTRGWRSTWEGAGAGLAVLAVIVAALGPALTALPINVLRLIVGALLLVFGLQWLRKAILRAGGLKAIHDEEATFAEQSAAWVTRRRRADWYPSLLLSRAYFGVLVAFIVVVQRELATRWPSRGRSNRVIVLAVGGG